MYNQTYAKLVFAVSLACASQAAAQSSLSGQVKSRSGEAVPFAVVGINNSQLSATANGEGRYHFSNLKDGTYILTIKSLGYLDEVDTVTVVGASGVDLVLMPSNKQLDEVVVNATRVDQGSGMAYSNVDSETLKKQNTGQDAPYMLNQLPSVVINSDAGNGVGYTGIRVRGTDATRINVTINGVPINDAESQGMFFVDMPDLVSSVNSIQVQRGVGASSNGAGAFGASINFQTNELQEKPYASVISTAGSYNTFRNTLAAGTGLLNNKFTLDARASKITSNGYIDRASSNLQSYYLAGGYYGKKTVIKFINFFGDEKTYQAWNYVPEDSIKAGNRTYNELGQYTDLKGNLKYYPNQTDNYKQNNFQLHVIHQFNARLSLNVTGHYTKGKGYYEEYKANQSFTDYNMAVPAIYNSDSTPVTTTNLVRRKWLDNDFAGGIFNLGYKAGARLNFTLGGGYNSYFGRHFDRVIWAQYASDTEIDHEYNHNTANKDDGNIYLKTNYRPLDNLNVFVDLQVRQVNYHFEGLNDLYQQQVQDVSFRFFNPKLGLSYNLSKQLNIYGSAAVGNKEPNRDDFVQNTPQHRPKQEQMLDLEGGIKYAWKNLYAAVNGYDMLYKNQLVPNGQVSDVGAAKRVNVDQSFRRGIELELNANLNRFLSIGGNLTLSQNKIKTFTEYIDSSYTYVNQDSVEQSVSYTAQRNYKNTDISLSPNIVSALMLTIKPLKNLEITFINKYIGRQYLDNTSHVSRSINPYNVINLRVNYTVKTRLIPEISLLLTVNNLFSTQYETTGYTFNYYYGSDLVVQNYLSPAAPINFLGGVSLKF